MAFKTKRIPIATESIGRIYIEQIRDLYGDDIANKVKLINEISFNVPVYDFGIAEDKIAFYTQELSNWYLEFSEEIAVNA